MKITQCVDYDVTPDELRRHAATRLFVEDRWTTVEAQAFLGR